MPRDSQCRSCDISHANLPSNADRLKASPVICHKTPITAHVAPLLQSDWLSSRERCSDWLVGPFPVGGLSTQKPFGRDLNQSLDTPGISTRSPAKFAQFYFSNLSQLPHFVGKEALHSDSHTSGALSTISTVSWPWNREHRFLEWLGAKLPVYPVPISTFVLLWCKSCGVLWAYFA